MEQSLKFNCQYKELKEYIYKKAKLISRLHTAKSTVKLKVNLFKTYILGKINYYSIIYSFFQQYDTICNKFEKLITISLKTVMNLPKYTSNSKLLYALGIMNFKMIGIRSFITNYFKSYDRNLTIPQIGNEILH